MDHLTYLLIFVMFYCACGAVNQEKCSYSENKYSEELNKSELSEKEMFERGHLKPFGSHRPPMETEILKYMISPQDFYMNFVTKHLPAVIKGVSKTWPAYKLWTDEYLEEKYGNVTMHMETKDDDKNNMPEDILFKDFLKTYKTSNLYLVDEVLPKMREDILLPLCLQCEEMDRFFFVSYYWHSIGETMSTVHIDTDENFLCVLKGHKKVLMVSPTYSHDLYADDANQLGVLDVNSSAIDLEKYPRIMNVHYYEANVGEGDCVYIPQMWWHQVYSRNEHQQAVALWWKSKPFWKINHSEEGVTSTVSSSPNGFRKEHSYSDALIDYEYWTQNVSVDLPRIKCEEQNVKMSAYAWETDKDADAPPTLGDGGDLEEEEFQHNRLKSPIEIKKTLQEWKKSERPSCDFDYRNKLSPCHMKVVNYDDLSFIRYVMDYCQHFEDRGCVINKPQLLNKMMNSEFNKMAFEISSKFKL